MCSAGQLSICELRIAEAKCRKAPSYTHAGEVPPSCQQHLPIAQIDSMYTLHVPQLYLPNSDLPTKILHWP